MRRPLPMTVGLPLSALLLVVACEPLGAPAESQLDLVGDGHRDEPITIVTLPDGTEARVVAGDVEVLPDVTVELDRDGDGWRPEIVNDRPAPIAVAVPEAGTTGSQLAVVGQSLEFDRGEIDAAEQPTDDVTFIGGQDRYELPRLLTSAADRQEPPALCVQVVDTDLLVTVQLDPSRTGEPGRAGLRGAEAPLDLACS